MVVRRGEQALWTKGVGFVFKSSMDYIQKNIHLPKSRDFSFLSFAQLIWNSKILIHRMNTENKSTKISAERVKQTRYKWRRRNKSTTAALQQTAGLHTTHVLSILWTPLWNAIPRDWLRIPKHCSSKFWALNLSEESLSKSCWAALFRLQI